MATVATANLVGITGIARRLVMDGALDEAAARAAMEAATRERKPLALFMAEQKLVSSAQLAAANSAEFGMPIFDVASLDPNQSAIKLVSEELVRKHAALPLYKRGGRLFVGISDPTNSHALDEIKFHTNLAVEPILVDDDKIRRTIDHWLEQADALADAVADGEGLDHLDTTGGEEEFNNDSGVDAKGDDTPVVKFINKVLVDAIRRGASDIHFEPYETDYRVRLRIDGLLKQVARVPVKLQARIAARLKVMAQLDIAEKRVPQDGRIKLNLSKTKQIDFRVSTLPTLFGEKVVLRILDGGAAKLGIDKLGYEEDQKKLFLEAVQKPYGMVLVTGPTGSGKTTTLYAALSQLNTDDVKIITVEDPVEYQIEGINQIQAKPQIGLDFANALRSIVRQDPDIIMIGEMRDLETARIAIQSALTGHLVLSTLHTNNAAGGITRLLDMGVEDYLLTSTVNGILAQRLVRRLEPTHAERYPASPEEIEKFGLRRWQPEGDIYLYHPRPSELSPTGYLGRTTIMEFLVMDDELRRAVMRHAGMGELEQLARKAGMHTMYEDGIGKALAGVTTIEEVLRVTEDA